MANYKKFIYVSNCGGTVDGKAYSTEAEKFAYILTQANSVSGKWYKSIIFREATNEIICRGTSYGLSVADAARITNLETAVEALEAATAKIKTGDKIISLDADNAIQSTLSLGYDSTTKKLQLKGIGDAVVADLDATAFVKDGIVESASLVEVAEEGVSVEVPYIKIVFNTDSGKEPVRFSVKKLVDIYNAANIKLTSAYEAKGTYTPANIKAEASMDEVVAELVAGVAEAKANAGVTSVGGKSGAITLKGGLTENGTINLAISDGGEISASINGLKSAAYSEASAFATATQGATADSAIQSLTIAGKTLTKESNAITAAEILSALDLSAYVAKADTLSASDETGYVKVVLGGTKGAPTVTVTTQTQILEGASDTKNGLALASDVKKTIETKESAINDTLDEHDARITAIEEDTTEADAIEALEARVAQLEDDLDWVEC